MRISDWSSDVCSSDLVAVLVRRDPVRRLHLALGDHRPGAHRGVNLVARAVEEAGVDKDDAVPHRFDAGGQIGAGAALRSEEHTSELQSLMRTSYAVFCLKKKKQTTQHNT